MGLVRADWHITVADVDQGDPFAAVETVQRTDPPADLRDLILQEADLDEDGVHCHLKDEDWCNPTCSTCPERGDPARAPLCHVGLAQEAVLRQC